MDKALVGIGLVIKPMVLAIPVITVEYIMRQSARRIVAKPLKDGKQPLASPNIITISMKLKLRNHNEPLGTMSLARGSTQLVTFWWY